MTDSHVKEENSKPFRIKFAAFDPAVVRRKLSEITPGTFFTGTLVGYAVATDRCIFQVTYRHLLVYSVEGNAPAVLDLAHAQQDYLVEGYRDYRAVLTLTPVKE